MSYRCDVKIHFNEQTHSGEIKPAKYVKTFASFSKGKAQDEARSYAYKVRTTGFSRTLDSQAQIHYPTHTIRKVVAGVEEEV